MAKLVLSTSASRKGAGLDKLRVGIIGAGLLGSRHARIYTELDSAEVLAVCDIRADIAEEVAKQYGAPRWHADHEELLKDPEVQAVSVCTPDFAHRDPVVAALDAGKHVLVEKPLATTTSDATSMVEAAKRSGRKLMVKYLSRWRPGDAWMKKAIDDGQIGEPLWGRGYYSDTIHVSTQLLRWAARSSPMWFLTCYHLDLLDWLIELPVVEVRAHGVKKVLKARGIDTWDGLQALLLFEGGFSFAAEASWIRPDTWPKPVDSYFEIVGSEGQIWQDNRYPTPHLYGEDRARFALFRGAYELAGKLCGPIPLAMAHFVDCVLHDAEPLVPVQQAVRHVEVLEAIHNSAESGAPIRLADY
jgi:predicted dehydrogenase